MIITKKFNRGDVVSIKLNNGEELIGRYVEEDDATITLNRPLMLAMMNSSPALVPIMFTADPDQDFQIHKSSVCVTIISQENAASQYLYKTTGIQTTGSAGKIVTGM